MVTSNTVAIGYTRVSTSDQAMEGVSLEAQEAKIRVWCDLNGYTLGGVFVDAGVSGKKADNRPELQKALAACSRNGALVVYSLSRLARSTRDTLEISDRLQRKGVDLVSLSEKIDTTSASGKMVFRLLAVLGEFERDQISERTSAAMQHKRSKGELVGAVPYGFSLDANGITLIQNATEQEVIRLAKRMRGDGSTLQKICDHLTKMGYTPRGQRWHPKSISNPIIANNYQSSKTI
ncbi:MAG: recombinase family protein [Magnetococcales bacterium]|nr:recombinase family protein [Magnetococcales bacterium]